MAKIYRYLEDGDESLITSFSVDVAQGDEYIAKIHPKICTFIAELIFIDAAGTGSVYTSIDSMDRVNLMLKDADDSDIQWTKWDLGDVTSASSEKMDVGYAPTAVKFTNSSIAADTIRFNYKGLYGVN